MRFEQVSRASYKSSVNFDQTLTLRERFLYFSYVNYAVAIMHVEKEWSDRSIFPRMKTST
jgi:hypothetical protein